MLPRLDGRYAGQPLLVTSNDYENQLFNGEAGVVVQDGDELAFAIRGRAEPIPLVRLSDVRPMHAMTIHRAQGSQFNEVTVLLPYERGDLVSRIHEKGDVLSLEHTAEGTAITAHVHASLAGELAAYAI